MAMTESRGQMLLIGGVLLAVTIIALAVVFNSAVYTSLLASEGGDDVSGTDVLGIQQDVRRMVGETIEHAIQETNGNADQADYVEANLSLLNTNLQHYEAHFGRIVKLSWGSPIYGQYVYNSSGNFSAKNGNLDWTVASDVSVRDFSATITSTSGSDPFTIEISGNGGDVYSIEVASAVTVSGPSGSTTCSATFPLKLNVTAGGINGNHCNALDFFERLEEPYDIRFRNGDNATGRYGLTVTPGSGISSQVYHARPQLFGVTVDLSYHGPRTDYVTTIRVAPGESQ